MGDAGVYALLGLGMVLGVLAIIWGVLSIFGMIFRIRQNHRDAEKTANGDNETGDDADDENVSGDEGAVVAAITAAVSLILEDEAKAAGGKASGFRVVSFRRAGGDRPWTR